MNISELESSLAQYNDQLSTVDEALKSCQDTDERESLSTLKADLSQLIQLTRNSLDSLVSRENGKAATKESDTQKEAKSELDDEYALFMQEMAKSGAYENDENQPECSKGSNECKKSDEDSDIEDELATLLGMKCAVYHTHAWGGQPSLHNAMVSAVVPHQDNDRFQDLQVRVLFTHPTHAEMLPCPFYLDGECRFSDEQCRYSHGSVVPLSELKEAIEPDFGSVKIGSRILLKVKPPSNEDISLTKKSTEKYHLWHRGTVQHIDVDKKTCIAKLEHSIKTGEKRKLGGDQYHLQFEEIYPLNNENDDDTSSDSDISDTEYPDRKISHNDAVNHELLVEKSLVNNAPAMGEWERHTRGIGSRLMLAMGYVPGTGLGASSDGRVQPVEARVLPVGKSLDHCMTISEKAAAQDPLKVEQKLKRLQKKEEERNRRAYEREKEREKRNVFNFLNKTLGDKVDEPEQNPASVVDIKQSTSRDLNIEQFKTMEDIKRIEKDILKLNGSLSRHSQGSNAHRSLLIQITEKSKELNMLQNKEKQINKEQTHRKDKRKMTVF